MTTDAVWELLVVRYATLATRRSEVFLHYDVYGDPDAETDMDYYFWVAVNAERAVVIDTGFAVAEGARRGRAPALDPRTVLSALSRPLDLIVTHCHYDHIGNLDAISPDRVVIAADEYEFWSGPVAQRELFHMTGSDEGMAVLARADRDGRLERFSGRHIVRPGIEVMAVGGHTPGQAMVLVDTADGRVLLTSDAVHVEAELELDRPFWLCADLPDAYRALELIRDLRDRGEVDHVLAGHEPDLIRRFPLAAEWPDGNVAVIGRTAA